MPESVDRRPDLDHAVAELEHEHTKAPRPGAYIAVPADALRYVLDALADYRAAGAIPDTGQPTEAADHD